MKRDDTTLDEVEEVEVEAEAEVDDAASRRARLLDSAIFYARECEDHARKLRAVVQGLTREERREARACARAAKRFRRAFGKRESDARRVVERDERQRRFGIATSRVGDLSVVGEIFATHVVPMLADDGPALANLRATSRACRRLVEMAGVLPHEDVRAFCARHAFDRETVFDLAVREKDFAEGNPNFETLKFACARWNTGPLPQTVFERYMNNSYRIHERLEEIEWLLANTSFDPSGGRGRACELVVKRLAYFMSRRDTSKNTVRRVVRFLERRVEPLVASDHKILTPVFLTYLEREKHLAALLSWARRVDK